MISKRGNFFVLGMSENTKGVHLSQVHQHSKKCTNALLGAYCIVGALETSAPPE